ncbi:REP-associated tyrosine transposase [Methylophaga sp.]|jgi:putative transposase|uniref:REP-associated tyrosine transposase n=1 Tax=Methylophaga sp. TaxID=2024840 RepID=UPI003F6FCF05
MQYRRAFVAGGTYFFTVNLLERDKSLLTDHIDLLKTAFRRVKLSHPFYIDAMVVLPDHLHVIWTLPENDFDFATRWRLIKSHFSRSLPSTERINLSRLKKSERGIWQRRYWEHLIRDELDYERHVDYIHYNPVKHGYVDKPVDWPYSSIHRFIENGIMFNTWSVGETEMLVNLRIR